MSNQFKWFVDITPQSADHRLAAIAFARRNGLDQVTEPPPANGDVRFSVPLDDAHVISRELKTFGVVARRIPGNHPRKENSYTPSPR